MFTHPTARTSDVGRWERGFTLIEIIVGMALLVIVIGGVYGVANGALAVGKAMTDRRLFETRIMNFVSAWREYLETLPPETRITVGEKPSRKFGKGSLLFENGSVPFAWTRAVKLAPAVEFKMVRSKTVPRASDLMVIHLRKPERATSPDEYEVLAQMPLLEGLSEFSWQFFDAEKKKWVTLWEDQPHPPLYMRLLFGFVSEPKTYEYTFWFSGGNQTNDALPPGAQPVNGNAPGTVPGGNLPGGVSVPTPQAGGGS
ncbi:MAG: Prepilin-type N-terminal cleavage/methylation protein [Verrucomicrobiaceae bacterium]|nr:Prepilin-type N-terminal cleavage/methylation protein [Verrucomicrobiaceae bacterium]